MDIEQGDLDGDGDIDLVIAMEFRPNVLLFNDGHGHFTDASASRLPEKKHDSEDIALADFDRDGDLDIIFVSEDDMINEYYLNNGKGYFTDVSDRLPVEATSNAVVAADLDGDGDLDLVLGNEDGNKLYLNIGKGVFTDDAAERLPVTGASEETRKVDLADIDGDGDLDLFFSNVRFRPGKNPANRLLVNNGKGFFTDESAVRLKGDNSLHSADAQFADLNGDKSLDLIVVNVFGGYPQAFINDGKGSFIEQTTSYFPSRLSGEVISLELMDANRDGVSDLYFGVFRGADFLLYGER
jgi:hypothetical protein